MDIQYQITNYYYNILPLSVTVMADLISVQFHSLEQTTNTDDFLHCVACIRSLFLTIRAQWKVWPSTKNIPQNQNPSIRRQPN